MFEVNRITSGIGPGPNSAPEPAAAGYCSACRTDHRLQRGSTVEYCHELMKRLERRKCLDIFTRSSGDIYSTDSLYGEARGKMIGVLEGIGEDGRKTLLYAFSGQFNGCWSIPGWAPPLFEEELWWKINTAAEKQIKQLTKNMSVCEENPVEHRRLRDRRKILSRRLMTKLHSLYTLSNFRGWRAGLASFFPDDRGIPTGTGDCCAPKLLNHAAHKGIIPIGISEFYWGRANRSGTRQHGHFYPACTDKCNPLMGFLLCGLDEMKTQRGIEL